MVSASLSVLALIFNLLFAVPSRLLCQRTCKVRVSENSVHAMSSCEVLIRHYCRDTLNRCLNYNRTERDRSMRYVLLIYGSEAEYGKMSQQEIGAMMQGHGQLAQSLVQSGAMVGGGPLQSTSTATTVRIRNGKTLITDGPFAETKEQLAGFYILNCKDLDEAIATANKIPDVSLGSVEIRPMVEV